MRDAGILDQLARGLYRLADLPPLSNPDLVTVAIKALRETNGGRADGTLERRFRALPEPDLLVLDDFGRKPIVPPGPADLYDLINERYERASILPTSNRA